MIVEDRIQRFQTFGVSAFWVGLAFFAVYPTTNWLASRLETHSALYLDAELLLPFLPEAIWLYLSMYVLFALPAFFLTPAQLRRLGQELVVATLVSGVAFVALPAKLGFSRTLPLGEPYRSLYTGLFQIDHPFNLVPSLHVVYTTAIVLAIARNRSAYWRAALYLWLGLVVASTVLTHQHHLLDVAAGLALAFIVAAIIRGREGNV